MPKFTIIEKITEKREVEADTAQDALDIWLNEGTESSLVDDEFDLTVDDRWVEDEDGNTCEVEDQ